VQTAGEYSHKHKRRRNTRDLVALLTGAETHSLVFDDVLVLQRAQDLDLSLEVSQVFGRAVLQLLHRHHFTRAILQRIVAALLHAAEVPLQTHRRE